MQPHPKIPIPSTHTSQARWQAVAQRDAFFHSSFVYGVKSTKIYCRPTCKARLARRANVVFYDTQTQAIQDGFRPCKRCKPDEDFLGEHEETVLKVLALLQIKRSEATMEGGLKELAKNVGVSPSYLCRVFKKTMGVTIGGYMKEWETPVNDDNTDCLSYALSSPSEVGPSAQDSSSCLSASPAPLFPVPARASSDQCWTSSQSGKVLDDKLDDIDLYFNYDDFDFDEWVRTQDFSNDNLANEQNG